MSPMKWIHVIQFIGFLCSQITNSILFYLVVTKTKKLLGQYRYVMAVFSISSVFWAWVELITMPIMHIKGPVFIVYMDSPLKYEKWIGFEITCLYCGTFSLIITLLAAQFFYRYLAMCKSELLPKIEGSGLILIFIPCIAFFILWFEFVYWGMKNTTEKIEYMREELKTYYDEDSANISFIAPMYWSIGDNGEKIWRIGDIMSSIGCASIIFTCVSCILFCAINIYCSLKSQQKYMSSKTLELNRQIFITLVFQTILPFFLMYCPVGLLITLPILDVYVANYANLTSVTAAIYPCIEPVIAIICIGELRRRFIFCNKRKNAQVISSIQQLSASKHVS